MALLHQKLYSASGTVSRLDMRKYETFIATTTGITFTLETGNRDMTRLPKPRRFVNATSGWQAIHCASGFLGSDSSFILGPYESTEIECLETSVGTFQWSVNGTQQRSTKLAWNPTKTFTTATPTCSTVAEYWVSNGICFFNLDITTADGAGATGLTVTLPIQPSDLNLFMPVTAINSVAGVETNAIGYIDMVDNTAANRVLKFANFSTWTDNEACQLRVSGFYEIDGWSTWTPTETYTTGTPTTTVVSRYKVVGRKVFFVLYGTTSDGKGATAATFSLPKTIPDNNNYVALAGYEALDTGGTPTYSDPLPYIDGANNTEASRLVNFRKLATLTNGKACAFALAGAYELYDWNAFTPSFTWGTADPASFAATGRYYVEDGVCSFAIYGTSTDGNAASSLTIGGLPVAVKYTGDREISVKAHQLVDTTWSDPCAWINAGSANVNTRKTISFGTFSTCTDAKTCTFELAGSYPVG